MPQITRKKNYLITLASSFGGMAISSILGFITVPISLGYWKVEKYGLWTLLTSILAYLSVSNLGLNSAATTLMAKNPDIRQKFVVLKRTFIILLASVAVFSAAFILLNISNDDWIFVLGKIPIDLKSEALATCIIMGLFYLVNIPFSLLGSTFSGLQKAYIENIFSFLLSILNFCNLLLVILLKGNLPTYAVINGAMTTLFNIAKLTYAYFRIYLPLKGEIAAPSAVSPENKELRPSFILTTGLRFFTIGIAAMVVWNTDNLVISKILGLESITPYAITFKLYQLLFNVITLTNAAILPLIAKEFGHENWPWINDLYRKMLTIASSIGGLMWIGGIFFMKDVVGLWAGPESYAGLVTNMALGGYSYLLSMVNLNSGLINSFNYIKRLSWISWAEAGIKILLSLLLVRLLGIAGAAIGSFGGSLLTVTWILPIILATRSQNNIRIDYSQIIRHFCVCMLPLLIAGVAIQSLVSSMVIRIILGLIAVFLYALITFNLIPADVRSYFLQTLFSRFKRTARKEA